MIIIVFIRISFTFLNVWINNKLALMYMIAEGRVGDNLLYAPIMA